jgi:hypothetical protein
VIDVSMLVPELVRAVGIDCVKSSDMSGDASVIHVITLSHHVFSVVKLHIIGTIRK